jgi:hypothetical protein
MVTVERVSTRRQKRMFINFPSSIYKDHPNYVPQLKMDDYELMNTRKHPFHQYGKAEHFIAYDNGQMVGRVAAIKNTRHNEYYKDSVGFFGMFECIDDQKVANALLDVAADWIKSEGLTSMRGPMNYSYTESQALLIENFDTHAAALLTYNPPYYQALLENYGLEKQVDLHAYRYDLSQVRGKLVPGLVDSLRKKNIVFRELDFKNKKSESKILCEILNDYEAINTDNFYPITEQTAQYFMRKLSPIAYKDMMTVVEDEQGVMGFACGIPDYHEYFKDLKSGRLFFDGAKQFLKLKLKPPKRFKFMLCGVAQRVKTGLVGSALITHIIEQALSHGFEEMDMSLIHEDNAHMQRICQNYGGERYKTYRVYERSLV